MRKRIIRSIILVIAFGLFLSGTINVQGQTATHRTPLDFDGDGKTDVSVARFTLPNQDESGHLTWWIRGSQTEQLLPVVQFGAFGTPGQVPIPADYDGDGKTDIAVFLRGDPGPRGDQSFFYVLRSSDGRIDWIQWGLDSDNPYLTQDFDGDGKADPTVVRCRVLRPGKPPIRLEKREWYILQSSTNYQSYQMEIFGKCDETRDRPIRGDFDGDGKADLAFFREFDVLENGETRTANRYYMRLSGRRNFVRKVRFDFAKEAAIIQGDFDGDGKTDIASARSELSGELSYWWWYWIRSSDGVFVAKQFGLRSNPDFAQEDNVVPGDYDGDGKWDLAVYRTTALGPRQAFFYIDGSQDGFKVVPWGLYLPDLPISQYVYAR